MEADERQARRERRRAARGRVFDSSIASPCRQICQIDRSSTHCIGCLRTLDEIRDWPIMTAEEKQAVLARIATLDTAEPESEVPETKA